MDAVGQELRRIPDKIVFVHGTFAARLPHQGANWWQLGSKFSQLVQKALAGLAVPSEEVFHWTGQNSDVFRVFDSVTLLDRLRRENEKGYFHVIAHSHGGMVLLHALMLAVEQGITLDNLRSWITVGTPFIFYKARIGRVVRHHFIPTLVALMVSSLLAIWWQHSWFAVSTFALGTLAATFTYLWYLAKSSSKRLRNLEQDTIRQYGSRWFGVRSQHDEAIALLKTALRLRTPVAPGWNDHPWWSYSQTGATGVPGRIPRRVWSRRGPSQEDPAFFVHPNEWLRRTLSPSTGWRMHAFGWIMQNMFFWPLEVILSVARFGYNTFLLNCLNRAAASVARSRLLGDDSPYFAAVGVADVPSQGQALRAAELPREVDEELLQQANANAAAMLTELRCSYISQLVLAPSTPILSAPTNVSQDPAGALVHCLYFEIESCQALIAAAVQRVCGGEITSTYQQWAKQAEAATLKVTEAQ